jgi:hypothetical protein
MNLDEAIKVLSKNDYLVEDIDGYQVSQKDVNSIQNLSEYITDEYLCPDRKHFMSYLTKLRNLKVGDVLAKRADIEFLQQDILATSEALAAFYDCLSKCLPENERPVDMFEPGKWGEG